MGSIINVSEPLIVYSKKLKQKDGKWGLELEIRNKDIKSIPRLRRKSISRSWNPLFLTMDSRGIDKGTYSSLGIFHLGVDNWESKVSIDSGSGIKPYGIKKMTFITKSGKESFVSSRMKDQGNLEVNINIEDPVIKIIVE